MSVRFEWDSSKAEANIRKHGIPFERAASVFFDPLQASVQDRVEGGEYRWRTIGLTEGFELLVVAHTVRDDGDGEVIRIISARHATRAERRRYGQDG